MAEARLYIVTGGVGFIGYHVCRALLGRGDRVLVVDDLSDAPYPRVMKERNLRDLQSEFNDAVTFEQGDIAEGGAFEDRYQGAHAMIHLAGLAGVRPSFRDPARYVRVNVEGTARIIEQCRSRGVMRIAIASSSSVYGNSTPLPAEESAPAIEPESPYAASKRGAELVTHSIAKASPDVTISVLRFFTVYGPRQRPEMAITLFARAILAGESITMFGDGAMRRDFTHVDDITRGVLAAADREGPKTKGVRAFNLGSGAPVTLADLVSCIEGAAGRKSDVKYAPVPLGDVDATFANIERARVELGWEPRVKLAEGLATVVAWINAS